MCMGGGANTQVCSLGVRNGEVGTGPCTSDRVASEGMALLSKRKQTTAPVSLPSPNSSLE